MSDDDFITDFAVGFQLAFELCPQLKYIDVGHDGPDLESWERLIRPMSGEYGDLVWKRHAVEPADIRMWML